MNPRSLNRFLIPALAGAVLLAVPSGGVPSVEDDGTRVRVTCGAMRLDFRRGVAGFDLALRCSRGDWRMVGRSGRELTYALFVRGDELRADGRRATWAMRREASSVTIGQTVPLPSGTGRALELHVVCTDEGVLIGTRTIGPPADGIVWAVPRIALKPAEWDRYVFWAPNGNERRGSLRAMSGYPSYAGVSPWEQAGDVAEGLDPRAPGLVVQGADGVGLGMVFVDYANAWQGARCFVQRHTPDAWLFYPAFIGARRTMDRVWAWLTPLAPSDDARLRIAALAKRGRSIVDAFRPTALPVPAAWVAPVAEFPADLGRREPPTDIRDVVVYTMGETTRTEEAVRIAARAGSEAIIRGWFKWAQAPELASVRRLPDLARSMGMLFGGGITCSALYDTENGITRDQMLDMATRGPDGKLVDAWGQPGIRHGSLSSPAYLEYLFRWCREQIDAGVDILFMDEHTAALQANEGFDDHSLADFRRFLLTTRGWTADDRRWVTDPGIPLDERTICPDGTINTFDYRAYLAARGFVADPWSPANPLGIWYARFREQRDARAWKDLTDRIRAYAQSKGRRVLIDANGFAPGVDLQVAGIWDDTMARSGRNDLSENAIPRWRQRVMAGKRIAGRDVPVVFFHDWGMGDTPFPFLALSPDEREIWIRVRGAEIYAAGGFFAFPVLGPFGCNAQEDGTLAAIQRQAVFFRTHRDLFLRATYAGCEGPRASQDALSIAVWSSHDGKRIVVHVINRKAAEGRLVPRSGLRVTLPLGASPTKADAVSPDWTGAKPVRFALSGANLELALPTVEAYAVVRLNFAHPPSLVGIHDPRRLRPALRWGLAGRSVFTVRRDGTIEGGDDLTGFLQGMLHTRLRQPPEFLLNAAGPCRLRIMVRAVASAGARLVIRVDGRPTVDLELPDRDGKNDGQAPEYDRLVEAAIPSGRHRVEIDNTGADWLTVAWIEWSGRFEDATSGP